MKPNSDGKKRLQVIFTDEAWKNIESITNDAIRDFEVGTITYSDVVNEMALNARIDIKALQAKHTNVKRSLRFIANQNDIDLDAAIKALTELKQKTWKRQKNALGLGEGRANV